MLIKHFRLPHFHYGWLEGFRKFCDESTVMGKCYAKATASNTNLEKN